MERIDHTANELTQTYSQSPQTSTTTIPREQHAALFALINKSRMLNGWQTRTAQELDQTIRTWGEIMNSYEIPLTAYPDLYRRAFDVRQTKMQKGGDVPQMDATLLVSQWTGEWGLKAELRQREVDWGRTLTSNAETVCKNCGGSGWRKVDNTDRLSPVKKCDHTD